MGVERLTVPPLPGPLLPRLHFVAARQERRRGRSPPSLRFGAASPSLPTHTAQSRERERGRFQGPPVLPASSAAMKHFAALYTHDVCDSGRKQFRVGRDQDNPQPGGHQFFQNAPEAKAAARIQASERLIQNQESQREAESAREEDLLRFAVGQNHELAGQKWFETKQPDRS